MKKHLIIASAFIAVSSFAQKKTPDNWQTLDPKVDKVYGTGSEQAYKTLTGKSGKTVIVAVIDSGIEVDHEDLKEVIWVNPGEIPNNNIDDDKNGYIDDINGWSFLGGKNGDINYEATELARLYQRGTKKFKWMDTTNLTGQNAKDYEEYKKIKAEFLKTEAEQEQQLKSLDMIGGFLTKVKAANNGVLSKDALKKYTPENETETQLKKGLKLAFTLGLEPSELETQIEQGGKMIRNMYKYNKLDSDSIRAYVVGDDVNNPNERFYGCNRVEGPDALHGSHVAGIIAAMRGNKLGIEGIANNVKIMALRAVPNGDERDKDVANAIRYAVDNGATIINMSFGKYYSPDKKLVDEAVKYAQSKDVLLIHAAGNESKNNDVELSFPNRELSDGTIASNWIQVGASAYKGGKNLIGSFSNYGQKKVDLFAPGVDIYSTVPDNKYISESGTSMASPSTAGVAALIRSYFPELKAEEVKAVMMKTVVPYKKSVVVPGSKKDKKKVAELCISGGFVNANNAVMELMGLNKKK
ncbi:MAG: S8 family peptidase [Bacteroidia bacterium]|nr:S8 family peptidase [Bacteroidia bacterium]